MSRAGAAPSDTAERAAIVGSGLTALAAFATLCHGGLAREEIVVFGTHADPTEQWRQQAAAIRQRQMRSESDGHLAPADFPGLALRAAWGRRSLRPLLQTASGGYHPRVDDFLAHADDVRERSGFDASFRRCRITRLEAVDGGFELDGAGPFRHVFLATGHPGLAVPDALAADPRVVHAYEPHEYASHVAVVGAGMAAATEWRNALAAGSEVVSVRRREPLRQPLNVPRPLFSRRGLAAFHRSPREQRAATLRELSAPSFPPDPHFDAVIAAAAAEGRFRVSAELNGAEQVIAATGFRRGYGHDELLARLVEQHDLDVHDRWLVLAGDSTIPCLTDECRTVSVGGVAGQWAFPAADTIAGAKYAARRFLERVCRSR
jgi:cation diffusion facilitator CzcD-associated flavoprotein CzcO